jgi:hypothetical protein
MAYRRSNGKGRKIEPAVKTMLFQIVTPATTLGEFTIDLSQCASIMNRRFYRQGINWAVSGMKVLSLNANPNTEIAVKKLPETWVMSNAWMKGFKAWQRMNDDALAETESVRPRFLDFKIYADSTHHTAGFTTNLLPLAADGGTLATLGEWEPSKVVVPTSATTSGVSEFEMIATGGSFPGASPVSTLNAVSLIEGYASSRGLPNIKDPNAPADADDVGPTATPENWIAAMFNEGTDQDKEVLDSMIGENNIAPYPFEGDGVAVDTQYPNGANQLTGLSFHDINTDSATTVGGITRFSGGLFPCGLIRITVNNTPNQASANYILQLDLVPGHHRGYLCEPMTEM